MITKKQALNLLDFNWEDEQIEEAGIDVDKLKTALVLVMQASVMLGEIANVQMFAHDGCLGCIFRGEDEGHIEDNAIAWFPRHSGVSWDGGQAD